MALALAAHGVGVVEEHHLGPFSDKDPQQYYEDDPCHCQGLETCRYCCWAFPVQQGIWMRDWDVAIVFAAGAAREAAAKPLTRAMLDLSSRDMELPFGVSPNAMARLLDIAMLTGNDEAVANLGKKCQLKPLRRWSFDVCGLEAMRSALWAGADFRDLVATMCSNLELDNEDVPVPQAVFLRSRFEDWQLIRHLLPPSGDLWRPKNLENDLAQYFYSGGGDEMKLSIHKLRAAHSAGVDLKCLFCEVCPKDRYDFSGVTLLDMAILFGQPECAKTCVDAGTELQGDWSLLSRVLSGETIELQITPLSRLLRFYPNPS